jgi:hypothetical protein
MEELTENEKVFLEEASKQAKDHPQKQALDDPMKKKLGENDFREARKSLEEKGLIDRKGATRGTATGGMWVTQAGMNKAEELFKNQT